MSQEKAEIVRGVRTPITISAKNRRRTLDERIFVLFPTLARMLLSAGSRLPPRSRLRRAGISRFVRQGFEAANRRDFDLLFLGLDPVIEFRYAEAGGFAFPDMLGVHRGHEAYRRLWEAGDEAWEDLKVEVEEVIDFGDRLLAAGRYRGHGRSTGISLNEPAFQVFTLRRGLVIRQQDFADRDKALEAVVLSE